LRRRRLADVVLGVTELVSELPFALSLASAGTAAAVAAQRRRGALNEALHELRRPMQALALALPPEAAEAPAVDSCLLLAVAAMERLDREINGGQPPPVAEPVVLRGLAEAAATRWAGAASAGLKVDWQAGEAAVRGDASRLSQALDNLIINGIEHGRGLLTIRARRCGRLVRVAVHDRGGPTRRAPGFSAKTLIGVLRKDGRHRGHGLSVVRRTAAEHGGRFELVCSEHGTEAVLELPQLPPELHA
jgi:signal transduction histidine kinase